MMTVIAPKHEAVGHFMVSLRQGQSYPEITIDDLRAPWKDDRVVGDTRTIVADGAANAEALYDEAVRECARRIAAQALGVGA